MNIKLITDVYGVNYIINKLAFVNPFVEVEVIVFLVKVCSFLAVVPFLFFSFKP